MLGNTLDSTQTLEQVALTALMSHSSVHEAAVTTVLPATALLARLLRCLSVQYIETSFRFMPNSDVPVIHE